MKIRKIQAILAMALLALPGSAVAEVSDGITVADVMVAPGQTQEVTVSYSFNEKVYYGFEITMKFPDGSPVSIVKKSDTGEKQLDCSLSAALKAEDVNYSLYSFDLGSEGYLFRGLSVDSKPVPQGDGDLLTFNVTAPADAAVGTYEVTVSPIQFAILNDKGIFEYVDFAPFTFKVTVSDRIILDENETEAPEASGGPVKVQVNRTIKANEWSTICLPFALGATQIATAFGDGVEVLLGDFIGCKSEKKLLSNEVVSIKVNFSEVTSIEANHPYIIKVSSPVSKILADDVQVVEPNGMTINQKETYDAIDLNITNLTGGDALFIGTYVNPTTVPNNSLFLSGNQFWYSKGKTKMQAFRGYFTLPSVLTDMNKASSCVSFNFEDADGIVHPIVLGQPASGVYDLQGRKVGESESECGALGKGVYIINGKKVVR